MGEAGAGWGRCVLHRGPSVGAISMGEAGADWGLFTLHRGPSSGPPRWARRGRIGGFLLCIACAERRGHLDGRGGGGLGAFYFASRAPSVGRPCACVGALGWGGVDGNGTAVGSATGQRLSARVLLLGPVCGGGRRFLFSWWGAGASELWGARSAVDVTGCRARRELWLSRIVATARAPRDRLSRPPETLSPAMRVGARE